uniref:Cadherin n=2 Tax=Strongyloides stercoralis TaxID=6248 RepID=A0A0K0E875_STRER
MNKKVYITFLLIIFNLSKLLSLKYYYINSKDPINVLVVDFIYDKIITPYEKVKEDLVVRDNQFYEYFKIINNSLYLNKSVESLIGNDFQLDFIAIRYPFQRIISIGILIEDSTKFKKFSLPIYQTTIRSDVEPESEITFNGNDIKIINQKNNNNGIDYLPISGPESHLFILLTKEDKNENYCMLYVKKRLDLILKNNNLNEKTFSFWVGAFDRKSRKRIGSTKVEIKVISVIKNPPIFDNPDGYYFKLTNVTPFNNIFRVKAHSYNDITTFYIEPDYVPFDISPWAGDVYGTKILSPDIYLFNIVGRDALGQESRIPIKIEIESPSNSNNIPFNVIGQTILPKKLKNNEYVSRNKDKHTSKFISQSKSRRELGNDIYFQLKESQQLGFLNRTITLYPSEGITLGPLTGKYLTIHLNGSIELTKPLNFEEDEEIIMAVQIGSPFKRRVQTIRIVVIDVDEPPKFINEPKPYLAVVPINRPIGYQIYRFTARDENGDGDNDVIYHLINTEPPGAFTIDRSTGIIRTALKKYEPGSSYKVYVQAIDETPKDKKEKQESEIAILDVVASNRAPQFYKESYQVSIPENLDVETSILHVQAKVFKNVDNVANPLFFNVEPRFDLFSENEDGSERYFSDYFNIEQFTGVVHLTKKIDYENKEHKKIFKLFVTAREGGLESKVPLTINIEDINDNPPVFTQPLYTATTKEDVEIGKILLKVTAYDKDSGDNGKIFYTVSDDHFMINSNGEIMAKKRLDADQNQERFYIYRFNVTATDKGLPSKQSTAQIHIRTENVNDEKPIFRPTRLYQASIAENAEGGTPVIEVQAYDPDKDQITYNLLYQGYETDKSDIFEIDSDTGLITIRSDISSDKLLTMNNPYNLTVIATDDGSCCEETSSIKHYQTAYVIISTFDVNNHKPEFPECSSYSSIAKLEEGTYKGTDIPIIVRVKAIDEDKLNNGDLIYSLYYTRSESRKPFVIDPITGDLRPTPNFIFDRENKQFEEVTVKATDKGERPLIGFCNFLVTILDVNDNPPIFEKTSYETSISKNVSPGYSILTVTADDSDAPHNSRITYKLSPDINSGIEHEDDINYVRILNEENGEITLVRNIPSAKKEFIFNVIASDNGIPEPQTSTVNVIINIQDYKLSKPQWQSSVDCKESITINEDIQINSILFKCYAIPGDGSNNPISYKMSNGVKKDTNSDGKFREFMEKINKKDYVIIRNMATLDYEDSSSYTLTITATDMKTQASSDKTFYIYIKDLNDVVPKFTVDKFMGTIEEELEPEEYLKKYDNKPITVVKAVDLDSDGPQNEIHYRILGGDSGSIAGRYFRIDEFTGEIYPLVKFDHETNESFILDVEASDGMNSSLPGATGPNKDIVKVQIFVSDINDNKPYFNIKKYQVKIPENAEIGKEVLTVRGNDIDSHSTLRYMLFNNNDGSNSRIPFGIKTDTGQIYVKEPLDYEKENLYILKAIVTDGKFNSSTTIRVTIENVNDNPPEFEKKIYETTINEEDRNVPKKIFKLLATDIDKSNESEKIIYKLEGQGVGEYFKINKYSGVIEVLKPLDRDPPNGVPVWKFVAQAIDNNGKGLVGYADVIVKLKDINDFAPVFENDLFGSVLENREPGKKGIYVMTAQATDNDDPRTDNAKIEYSISRNKEINGEPVFRIDKNNGKIFAMKKFDRESNSEKQFQIEIHATDKGRPPKEGSANVTIYTIDTNDNPPHFEKNFYEAYVPETAPIGSAILSISAIDSDNKAADNIFYYELANKNHEYFYMTTEPGSENNNVGVLRVKKTLDYESPYQREGFTLQATVFDGKFYNTTKLKINILDKNDCPPKLEGPASIQIPEDTSERHIIGWYKVSDGDANDYHTGLLTSFLLSLSSQRHNNIDDSSKRSIPSYFKVSNFQMLLFIILSLLPISIYGQGGDFHFPTSGLGTRSRFNNFAGTPNTDLTMSFITNISEAAPKGTFIAQFGVSQQNSKFTYRIDRETDPKRQFSIDQNGALRVAEKLDREDISRYFLRIEVNDEAGNRGQQMVTINLSDVNDQVPYPVTRPDPCIFWENTDPDQQLSCLITGIDRDTPEFGPPFKMRVADTFKYGNYFNITFNEDADNGNGALIVKAISRFDREASEPGKLVEIPVIIQDRNGTEGQNSVFIVIGDQNDNPMNDGETTIYVYSYLGRLRKTSIGRVYVNDKDDWDLGDKIFTKIQPFPEGFDLLDNGTIIMDSNMGEGTYNLASSVYDSRRNENATGSVVIFVKNVPKKAFDNQGAVRILMSQSSGGIPSPEYFVKVQDSGVSPMDNFKKALSDYLGNSVNIDIFSVKQGIAELQTKEIPVVDVRFSVSGSNYLSSTYLNGIIAQNRKNLEREIGANIVSAGIDMCLFTTCDNGCQTINDATYDGVVVNANQTIIVGVDAISSDKCVCPVFEAPKSCQSGLCLNDGVCHNVNPSGFFCECRNDLLKGFRCQGTTRSFSGQGYAWFKPMPACTSLNISFSFMTKDPNGLLLYNGPMGDRENRSNNINLRDEVEYKDYIAIRLINGYIFSEIRFNRLPLTYLNLSRPYNLADGDWHTIRIAQTGKQITLTVDDCQSMISQGQESCFISVFSTDDDERLNVNSPLQIGGVAPLDDSYDYTSFVSQAPDYNGCIRNLYVNGEQYDLATPDHSHQSSIGCKLWGSACDSNSINSASYCIHGDCYATIKGNSVPKCICDPGWGGDRCDQPIEWVEFSGPGAFIEYNSDVVMDSLRDNVGLLFIPGKNPSGSGDLTYGGRGDLTNSVYTYMEKHKVTADVHINSALNQSSFIDTKLSINDVNLSSTTPYWLEFNRDPTKASLSLDGVYEVSEPLNKKNDLVSSQITINRITLGNGQRSNGFSYFTGCVGTYRWNNRILSLVKSDNFSETNSIETIDSTPTNPLIHIGNSKGVKQGCEQRISCANLDINFCPTGQICVDFWKGPFCTCNHNQKAQLNEDGTILACGTVMAYSSLGISVSAIVLILVSISLLMLLIMLMIVYTRRHSPKFDNVRPEEIKRDNIRSYALEGGGEADNTRHNIDNLRKPVIPLDGGPIPQKVYPIVDERLNSRINDLETDPNTGPYDELRMYNVEGDNVSRLTLDSLESTTDGATETIENSQLDQWGPRFESLADIYGQRP